MASIPNAKKMIEISHKNGGVPFLLGPPGVGKSSLVYQYANAIGAPVIEFRPNLHDPVDLMGLPTRSTDGSMVYLVPDWLPKAEFCAKYERVIVFIDEFPQATVAMQNGLSQLILDRRLGNYRLPDNVDLVVAGNRDSDRAGTNKIPLHIANRVTFVDIEFSLNAFLEFLNATGAPEHLKAFAKFRPSTLESFDPKQKINCTARSLVKAGQLLEDPMLTIKDSDPEEKKDWATATRFELLQGTIGEGATAEYTGFLRLWESAPDIEGILADPSGYDVPRELDVQFAIAQMLLADEDLKTNLPKSLVYVLRLSTEVTQTFMVDLLQRAPEFASHPDVVAWVSSNLDVLAA